MNEKNKTMLVCVEEDGKAKIVLVDSINVKNEMFKLLLSGSKKVTIYSDNCRVLG